MKALASILIGGATAAAAILLHLQYPPLGLAIAAAGTYFTFRELVHHFYGKRYGFYAACGWIAITWRAAVPGNGNELLVVGNLWGEVLVLGGSAYVIGLAITLRR